MKQPEHSTGRSQNKGTEKLQRRASLPRTGLYPREVGGRRRGKEQTQSQRRRPLSHCKQASSFYPKTPWDSGWSAARRVVARGQLLRTNTSPWHPTGARRNWGWGCGGERVPKPLAAWAAQAGEGTKRRRNRVRAFVEDRKTGTALNTGPAPYRAARSLSRVDGKAQTPLYGANPVWPEHGECSPHTATSACSAPPSPQQDWTEPPPACVRAEIRHRRDSEQKPNKQRESLQKGPMQQVKIPEGNTDYTGRGL